MHDANPNSEGSVHGGNAIGHPESQQGVPLPIIALFWVVCAITLPPFVGFFMANANMQGTALHVVMGVAALASFGCFWLSVQTAPGWRPWVQLLRRHPFGVLAGLIYIAGALVFTLSFAKMVLVLLG